MDHEIFKDYTTKEAEEFLKSEGIDVDQVKHEGSVFMRVLHEKIELAALNQQLNREVLRLSADVGILRKQVEMKEASVLVIEKDAQFRINAISEMCSEFVDILRDYSAMSRPINHFERQLLERTKKAIDKYRPLNRSAD